MIPEDILTETELCPIAECWTRKGLETWLRGHNIPFVVSRSGWARVHRKALEHAMGVHAAPVVSAKPIDLDINFDTLR